MYSTLYPEALLCDGMTAPIGIDNPQPQLSWRLISKVRGALQSAYQIKVASSLERLEQGCADVWDSGKVESSASAHIKYEGKPLESDKKYYWKVQVWDDKGQISTPSLIASWKMGLLNPLDWEGTWITANATFDNAETGEQPSPIFRKEIELRAPVRNAMAYICGAGLYELHINGEKIGDHVVDPAFTKFDKCALYVAHDITASLQQGCNALGIMLGCGQYDYKENDWWDFPCNPWKDRPKGILQINVEYTDGTAESFYTDRSWKMSAGPVVRDNIRSGEIYDANREQDGWDKVGFNDSEWKGAIAAWGTGGILKSQVMPPMRVVDTFNAASVKKMADGSLVVDAGRNLTGWLRIKVTGKKGDQIKLVYGERLGEDGGVDISKINCLAVKEHFQTDIYTCKDGENIWEPRFTYHGFQYVQVYGWPGEASVESFEVRVVHTDFESVGSFSCSKDLFNKLQQCTRYSYLGNFHGLPTDCPHREKNGWTGDAQIAAEVGLMNFDSTAAYTKWLNDFADGQRANGQVPCIVPSPGWGYGWGSGPAWDSAFILIPWYVYLYRGDISILARHYEGMKKYLGFLDALDINRISDLGLGDWCPPTGGADQPETPVEVTSTGYYYIDAKTVAEAARLLGYEEDYKYYSALAEEIRQAFIAKFLTPTDSKYKYETQTALSCALYQGIAKDDLKQPVLEKLLKTVEQYNYHLNCGILGTKYIMRCLTDLDQAEAAYKIAAQEDFPSWGNWIKQGATTLWETWNADASLNHIMFGDIGGWFYQAIGGLSPDPEAPGFKHFKVKPFVVGEVNWAKAEYQSIYGWIRVYWRVEDGKFKLSLEVPANTTATVYLPTVDISSVTEGGNPAANAAGISDIKVCCNRTKMLAASGTYEFECAL